VLELASTSHLAGATIDANGVPHKTYTKDLIRTGTWTMPANGHSFTVTGDDLIHWAKQHDSMLANGFEVPTPDGHTDDAAKNMGFVRGMFVDGDTLKASIELIGDDAIQAASRNYVSIYVPESVKDGKGNVYPNAIAHVAMTPIPVIEGQGGFVPIAASRGGSPKVPVYRLSLEGNTMNPELAKVCAAMGITDATDDAGASAAILAALQAMKPAATAAAGVPALQASLAQVKAENASLKLARTPDVDPDVLEESALSVNDKFDALVATGKITPAVRLKLGLVLIGSEGARPALCLSMKAAKSAGFAGPLARAVADALMENDPVKLGEQTKRQALTLARETPGQNGEMTPEDVKSNVDRLAKHL